MTATVASVTPIPGPAHVLNWTVGWGLVLAGFVVGAWLGLSFHRDDFWGGYASFRRRLVRLGHVALEALGMLNLLFALSAWPQPGSWLAGAASGCLVVGGVSMPTVCFLAGWRPVWGRLFFVPVTALVLGVAFTLAGGGR